MASVNTDINLNIKSRGGARAAKDVNAAQQALRKLGAASQDTNKETINLNRNTTRLGQASASAGRQFSSQAAGLGGLVGAYAGAAATVFALQQAFSALNRAAQVEQLIAGTNTLAAKVGENGSKIIKSLQEITEGQLTLADASEKANLALSSGFSTKQIEDLGKVATKVSKALGRNLGDAFERLVRGATKLEPELLDELGIFTKIDPATRKYAQSIGKAVSELSEFERRQAFVNAIIEEGTRKFNDLDTSAPNAQKSLNTLAVTLQNLGTQFGILLANYLSPVADFFANSLAGAISIFGLVATQISRTAFTQLIQGSDALAAKFEEQRIAFLSNAKQTEKSRKALTDFNQTMMAVPRITTVFRGGDAIENTAKQLFALGQAGKISAANINDFQEAMVKQAQLATEAANKYQAAQDKLLAKQAGGRLTRAEQRALADYSLLLSNAQRDQLRFAQAASIANAAVKAQSAALTVGAKAWRVFGAAISFAGKAASIVFRAFNLLLLALSIGPLILEIAGKIDIFNKAMEKLKDMFISTKNAAEDTSLGMSALANSLDSGTIITKYEDIGIAAKRSQQIQLEALDDLAKILQNRDPFERLFASGEEGAKKASVAIGALGGAAAALGIATLGVAGAISAPFIGMGAAIGAAIAGIDELVSATLGTEPVFRGALNWITSWFVSAESEAEATARAISSLQQRIADLNEEFAKTGNRELLVLIDTYKLFIDQVNSSTVAQQQFIGAIARLTGQNANLIQDLLGDSFTEIGPVLDGVQLGIKGVGNSIEQLSGVAAQGMDTFVGFQAVLLQTEKANNSGATSAAEYIEQIQALRTAQANLGNVLESNERRIETTKSIIEDLNDTIATTTDSAVVEGLTLQVEKLQEELEILQSNTDAMSASFDRNKDKVNDLSASYDILNAQVARNDAIIKAFDTAARSVSNFDLTGIISPESGAIAANSTEELANKITVLRLELEKLSDMQSEIDRLQRSLFSATDAAAVAQLTNQINTLKKQIADSDSRRDFLNKSIAGSQLSQVRNLQNMNKLLDDIIRKQQQQNTLTAMQGDINLMQATEAGAQIAFDTQKRLLELDIEHRRIQREIAKEKINTEKVVAERLVLVAEAMKEQARIQSDIRKEKINGLIQELQYHKDILAITQDSMDSEYNFFDENTNKLFKALSKLGEIGLDNDITNQEERLRFEEIRMMEDQMAHDWAIVDARALLLKKEAELLEQEKADRLAEIQDKKALAALEAAESMRRLRAQRAILEEQIKLDLQRTAFEKENQARENQERAREASALLRALQDNPEVLKAEIGEEAFAALQQELGRLSASISTLNGTIQAVPSKISPQIGYNAGQIDPALARAAGISTSPQPAAGVAPPMAPISAPTSMEPSCCRSITTALNGLPQKLAPAIAPVVASSAPPTEKLESELSNVATGLNRVATATSEVAPSVQESAQAVIDSQATVVDQIVKTIPEVVAPVPSEASSVEVLEREVATPIRNAAETFNQSVEETSSGWREALRESWVSIGETTNNLFGGATEEASENYIRDTKNASEAFTGGFTRLFNELDNQSTQSTRANTKAVEEASNSWVNTISNTASDFANQFGQGIDRIFGTNAEQTVSAGEQVRERLVVGGDELVTRSQQAADAIAGSAQTLSSSLENTSTTITQQLNQGVEGVGDTISSQVSSEVESLGSVVAPTATAITTSGDTFGATVTAAANAVAGALQSTPPPASSPQGPSTEEQIAEQKLANMDAQIAGQEAINAAIFRNLLAEEALAAQKNKTTDEQIRNLNTERANMQANAALERELGAERINNIKAAIEQERKKSRLQALQDLSNTFVEIGGALNALILDDKEERLDKAKSAYTEALSAQENALESVNSVIDNYIDSTDKMKEVLEERRELEMDIAKVIGSGVNGAKEYYRLQEEYINSIETTISQGNDLRGIGMDKAFAEIELARAELNLAATTQELEGATASLDKAKKSLFGRLANGITIVGQFTNSIITLLGVVKGIGSIKGNIATVFSDGFKGLGELFEEALGTQTRKLNEATYDAADMSSLSQESFLNKYSSMASGEAARPGELDGSRLLDTLGAAAAGAFAAGLVKSEASIGEIIGNAVGKAIGKFVTPVIGNVLGNVLGGLGNFVAPIIGGFIGNFLGNWLGNLFAKTKTSTGTANFATGGVSSGGEQASFVGGIAEFAVSINSALTAVTKLETGLSSLTAVLSTKGSKLRAAYVTAGGYTAGFDPQDSKSVEKAVFKVIALSFRDANAANKDIQDAVARLDFGAAVQQNLEKLQFAAMFDDIVTNIELATNNYSDLGSYIADLTRRLSLSINEYTNGAVENFERLREKTEDVFGPMSTQLDRLLESQVNYLLEYAGLYEDTAGNIQLVQDFTKNVNNMALVIATVTAQTMAFKDALIGAGKSAQEAEDALRQGIELKLRAIFDQFEDSLDAALAIGAGIDSGVIPKFQEILQYQKDIVADAVVIQETLAGYGTIVRKTEELVYRQRAEMIAEASYVELIALRNLTAAGSEFSNVMVKAGADAEIARRKIESMFEGILQMADLMQSTAQTMRARSALRFAQGGPIPKGAGAPNKDSVPAMLMPGEFVINKQAAENIGLEALNAINNQEVSKFATGGSVQATLGTQLMTNAPTSYIGGDLLNVYTLPANMLSAFQKFGQDTDLVLSFKEASEIINQANYELFDTYKNLLAATGASGGFNAAMQSVYDALKEGDIILAQARFSLATSLISATTEQEAYNRVIADTRANQVLNTAGINKALDGVDNLTDSLNEFYFNAQTSSTTYADLSKVTSELNLLLGKEVITSEEYSNALNSVLKAYEDSLIKIQEYTEFFLDLQDLDISATGIIQDVREIEYAFLDGTSYILQAVKDGFIDTVEATSAQQRLQTALNRQRIDLLKQASEEELIVLKNANSDIVDVVIKTGAITELVARRLDAVAEAYGSFESRLVSVFNSTLTSTERFTNQVVASIESTIKEAGIALDSSTPTAFLGTLATFLQEARNGTVDLGDLSKALGELNYQLSVSEEIDTETYKTGVNILASSFERFATYANDLNLAFIEAQDALKIFGIEIKAQFKELGDSLRADIEGIVNIYKTTFNDLKSVYETAVGNQASAEEELYNALFAAQQAFVSAGGNLEGHTQRISDIVNGLDPQYMGYPGILAYLDQLSLDIQAGVARLGEVDTKTSLSVLQANLTKELANLSALQALPDSADKFVKISRSLSAITSLEEQISAGTAAAGSKLAEAGMQLVKVEQELNKNNLDATKRNVDLTLTDITEDLVLRAQNAREEYNKTNEILDGYNTALANSTNFTQGLADATVSAADAIFEFNNSLGQLEDQWVVVQTAVSDLASNNLTDALVNIRNENDQYAISLVSASEDINLAYTTLTDRISEYLDVEAALNSWNSLYSTVIDTSEKLPSAEFQELSDNFEKIKLVVADVATNIGGSVDTFGEDLQNFLLNAIAILESPITISPPAVAGLATAISQAATVASGNLVTTATTGNTYYGTDLTNELLYRILQELQNGLSVSSQSSTGVSTTSSYAPGSIPNLFDTANLSSLTGQLFSVEEPLTRPADFFYIVAPMIVGPEYFFAVKPGETVWTQWFEIRPDWTWWWQWFAIQRDKVNYLYFFDLDRSIVTAWDFFNKQPVDSNILEWVNIIPIDADYRTFFDLVSAMITTNQLFSLTGKQNTDFWYWFNDPSRRNTNFYEWFTKISLEDVYYYNFFTLRKNEVMFWDWFDISDRIPITQLIEDTPIKFDQFFYIQTRGTTWNDWFNDTQLIDVDYSFFFIIDQVAIKWTDFFMPTVVDAADFIVPGNKYNGDEFFDIKPSVIYGAEIYSIGDPLLLPGESFVNIDNTRKLQFGVEDIFHRELIGKRALTLTDVFSNWDIADGWDITNKAVVSVWDLFDENFYKNQGLAQKVKLKASDIFSNITYDPDMFDQDQIGLPSIDLADKYSLEASDLFLEPTRATQSISTWYFDPTKYNSSFWDWFKAPTDASKVKLTDFLDAAPVTDLLLLVGDPMEVTSRDIFALSTKQEDLSEVTADRLYNIIPIDLNFGDVINPGPYKLEAHHVIDFDHLYENKYVAQASDVIDIQKSIVPGKHFWEVIPTIKAGSYFWGVVASNKAGSAFFNVVNASSVDGEDVFTPNPTALPGAAFFSIGVRKIVDANDLLEIGTPAKIEVTGVFESEFKEHLEKLQELIDNIKYLLLDTHWLSYIADDMHNNAYNTAWHIYDLFERAHHDLIFDRLQIISSHTGYLPLIYENSVYLSSINEILSEYQPYLAELDNYKHKTDMMVAHLYEIEYNTKEIRDYAEEMVFYLTRIYEYMSDTMDVRLSNIEASTNNTYAVNNLWLPIIAGPQNVQAPIIGATVFDLLLDELQKHTVLLNNIDTNTNNTFMLLGGLSLGTIISGGNAATISNGTKLDHLSDNLDHLSSDSDHLSSNLDHLSNNLDHISDNLDHLSDNLDTVVARLDSLLKVNATRYVYPSYSSLSVPYKEGGLVQGPGTGTSDSIPARLSNGEFVLTSKAVSGIGTDFLNTLNSTGDLSTAIALMGIKGDSKLAHINDAEAQILKALGGSGSMNSMTGLPQFFFDGKPVMPSQDAINTLANSKSRFQQAWYYGDGLPQWLYANNASSYAGGYNLNYPIGYAVSDLIRTASYAKGEGLNYKHKNWHRIGDYYWGAVSSNPGNYSEFGYDWNSWSSSIDATSWMGNPSSLQGTYGYNDWPTLARRIWNTWGTNSGTVTPEGRVLAQQYGIPGFAEGGYISGQGSNISDSILAWLSNGEYVIQNSSVDKVGEDNLNYINRTGNLPASDINVEINITNNGQSVDTEGEPEVKFIDGKVVVDIVLKDLRTNGPIKKTIKKLK